MKPGSVVLTKVDADSNDPLENAVFTLQDEQGNPLQEGLTTGTDGKLTINDLKPGKYKLVETQAPDGYQLDATPVEFEIVKNQQTAVEVEKTNTLKQSGPTDTPKPKPDGSTNTSKPGSSADSSKPGNSGHSEGDKHKKEKGSKKLPATGEKDTQIFSIIGLGILAILGTYISRKKTK